MGTVIRWPRHVRATCRHEEGEDTNCGYCLGRLFTCAVCGASEGELASDCPGERLHPDTRAAVYNGHLDYRGGRWVALSSEARRPLP